MSENTLSGCLSQIGTPQDTRYWVGAHGYKEEEVWQYSSSSPASANFLQPVICKAKRETTEYLVPVSANGYVEKVPNPVVGLASYYANTFDGSSGYRTAKEYRIDGTGAITDVRLALNNPDAKNLAEAGKAWHVAQRCNRTKLEMLGNKGYFYANPSDCFGFWPMTPDQFVTVVDLSDGSVVTDWSNRNWHTLLAIDGNGKAWHATGRGKSSPLLWVYDMYCKLYDKNLVGQPRPSPALEETKLTDYGNDGKTDKAEASWFNSSGEFFVGRKNAYTASALAVFDPIWKTHLADVYRYYADLYPVALNFRKGDKVKKGDLLFTMAAGFTGEDDTCFAPEDFSSYIEIPYFSEIDGRVSMAWINDLWGGFTFVIEKEAKEKNFSSWFDSAIKLVYNGS